MNGQQSPGPPRRQVLKGAGVIGGVVVLPVGGGVIGWQTLADRPDPVTAVQPGQDPSPEALADAAVSGRPGKDGIPSIDKPRFVPANRAGFLDEDDPVFGLEYRGEVRAYPQLVLVWHGIVLPQQPGADMSRLLTVFAQTGDAWDGTVAAIAVTPRPRHPRPARTGRGLPGDAPGHLHRPRSRLRRADRTRRPRVRTGTARVPSSARGWIHKAGNDGLIELVEDADRGVLIGPTAGPAGGEGLYGLAVAIQTGIPADRLRHMMFAYPTFHRAVEEALADLGHGD